MKTFPLVSGFLALVLLTACSQATSTTPTSPEPAAQTVPTETSASDVQVTATLQPDPQAKEEVAEPVVAPKTTTQKVPPKTTPVPATPAPATTPSTTPPAAQTPAPAAKPEVKTFNVSGGSFFFTPSALQVNKGDTVRIVFTNAGGMHNLKIDAFGAATKTLSSGESDTIEFVASKTGSFEYHCGVGSHRAMGQIGTLTVK